MLYLIYCILCTEFNVFYTCFIKINICCAPYFSAYPYISITVSHFINSWNQINVFHWKLVPIFVISIFAIITLAAVIKYIEILLHF